VYQELVRGPHFLILRTDNAMSGLPSLDNFESVAIDKSSSRFLLVNGISLVNQLDRPATFVS
jgi:hypothetical protein